MANESIREHHFVPQFLLRPWGAGGVLQGYWWNSRRDELVCKRRGTKSFCFQLDLLSLRDHPMGKDAIERVFFGEIDNRGAAARDALVDGGPGALTGDQRCDFARLLLSLEARRPINVAKLRKGASRHLAKGLDDDPEILDVMARHGIEESPSSYYERETGTFIADRALANIQALVDNPLVGGKLINAHWHVVRLGAYDGSLVLSDRPLIRIAGYDQPGATWVLPLTPCAAFVAVNHRENMRRIRRATPRRFAKLANVSSARQAERFVFCSDSTHERWIGKFLSDGDS